MPLTIPELMPPGVRAIEAGDFNRYFFYSGSYYTTYSKVDSIRVMVEIPPGLHTLVLTGSWGPILHRGNVAMPWQYFVLVFAGTDANPRIADGYLFWSKHRLKSLDEELITALIPDIDEDYYGHLCFGDTTPHSGNLTELTTEATARLFCGAKNSNQHQGGWNIPKAYPKFEDWVAASEADPLCYLTWKEFDTKKKKSLRSFFSAPEGAKPAVAAPVLEVVAPKPAARRNVPKFVFGRLNPNYVGN